jgi:hypothetical protein
MKFFNFFLLYWVIFALLDPNPDPDSKYRSVLDPDPDQKPCPGARALKIGNEEKGLLMFVSARSNFLLRGLSTALQTCLPCGHAYCATRPPCGMRIRIQEGKTDTQK